MSTGTPSPREGAPGASGASEEASGQEESAPRLSQPAVEMVSDLQAAIGAFEIASPIEPLPGEDTTVGLDSWTASGDADDLDDTEPPTVFASAVSVAPQPAQPVPTDPVEPTAIVPVAPGSPADGDATTEMVETLSAPVAEPGPDLAAAEGEPPVVEEPDPAPVAVDDPVTSAIALGERGERLRAIGVLRTIVTHNPGDSRARLALVSFLEAAGDTDAALAQVGQGLERMPDEVVLLIARAGLQMAKARHESAEADLRRALKVEEANVDALTMLGLVCTRRGRWREAIEPLRRAADLAPERPAIHYYLGEALNKLDRLPEALASYEMAASLEPDNWRAHKGVGIVLDRLSRPQDAADAYRRARETHRP